MTDRDKEIVHHDLNNAIAVLLNSFEVTLPSIREAITYIKNNQAYDLLNEQQLEILEKALDNIGTEISTIYHNLYDKSEE